MSDTVSPDSVAAHGSAPPDAVPFRGMRALVADGAAGRPRLPMLGRVVDRLTELLTVSFRALSRGAEARTGEPRPLRFGEFVETIPSAASIAVLRVGYWNGPCLAVIDGVLANTAIGLMLGGGSCPANPNGAITPGPRDRTPIERTVLERLARDLIAANLSRSFVPLSELDITFERMASDPSDAAIAKPRAQCLSWRIGLTIEGTEGTIAFLLPYSSIEPLRGLLSRDPSAPGQDHDPAWHQHLGSELPHISMKVRAVLERRRIAAAEVLRWRVGSTVMLNHRQDEPVEVFCNDLLVLRARMAEQDGRIALHVDERRLAEDWPARS